MTTNKNKIIEELSKMSLTEINDLIIMIEKKFSICLNKNIDNIDNTEVNDNKDNEKKLFNIKLINIGNNKISVIKNIRSILNLGLKESKEIVESCPVLLKSDLNKSEAESFKKILEDSGASVILE
ncbi:50S ribosomal protein L7/L12 [Candidatus Nardonella dryophthoridicola]|uniref:Large ribosomal subunit protein bL12 n=1 Tax=endosymbiont of Rhynchophorus ferrugineus TaxID=1972133 RepID=A0A2Z5TPV1_9GAMM|nr:50S ribosomal protein L7/L12 [Candidatus Nardonella dryophthoridicola]QTJ62840.1 50S ribosomal protein L7/L12 [Candidatus Nardonella dryophthoridicola]BBA85084.1 50S ribosomal protein L7/L12 [endosymbiont of Rhynchophorus ferrugineus]